MRFFRERREVLAAAVRVHALGLARGTSGNVSARVDGGMVITPSGRPYDRMTADDMVEVLHDGRVPGRQRVPSSEWRIHHDVYAARPEIGAVVHTHPRFGTTLSILRREIPAVHYMIAVTGDTVIRCAAYATFGTPELSRNALAALGARSKACLLANHGAVALGRDLDEALRIAEEAELLAEQYWRALQIGAPVVLGEEEMRAVLARFETYGQR
jgi:L-fuculose-phosphate aldolase